MEVATATHTKTDALPSEDAGTAQHRTAHTLTACCRCRTVSLPSLHPGHHTHGAVACFIHLTRPAQDEMRPRPAPVRALRAHKLALRVL
jgi:hypothetical protein